MLLKITLPPPATTDSDLLAFNQLPTFQAANNYVRVVRASGLPVPPAAILQKLMGFASTLSAVGMALSLGGDARQKPTESLSMLTRPGVNLNTAFEVLNGRVTEATAWPDLSGERAAMKSYLIMARETIEALAVSHPEQAAAALAALFQLYGVSDAKQGKPRLQQLARDILARSGLTQPLQTSPRAAAPAQNTQAQQTREAFSTALQQARSANEQLAAMQSQAAKLQAQAQTLMQQYQHQATGGVAARGKLSQTVAQLEKVLKAQRALYAQANAPVAALKQAQARMQTVAGWARAANEWRSGLSQQIQNLASQVEQGYSTLKSLKASAGTTQNKKPSALAAPAAATPKMSEYAPGSPDKAAEPTRTDEGFQRRISPWLTPLEQQQWEQYAENHPDVVTIVREAAHDATDADNAEAVRALLRGAYAQDVVAWLRAGGVGSGRLPPHRPMRAPALSPEEPERPHSARGKVWAAPSLVMQAGRPGTPWVVPAPAPVQQQIIRWGVQAGLPLFPLHLPVPVHAGKFVLRLWRDNINNSPPPLPTELLFKGLAQHTPVAAIANFLAQWLPEGTSMRLATFPPAPAALQTLTGRTRQHSLRVNIQDGLRTGAIVTKLDGSLSLNVRPTPEGPSLPVPIQVSIVDDVEFEPTNIPLVRWLLHLPVSVKRQQLHVWEIELVGPVPPQIIAAITRTLKRVHMGSEVWLTPGGGADWLSRSYFAPSSLALGLYHRLPKDWEKLGLLAMIPPDRLKTPDQILKSTWFGLGHGILTFYRQTIDNPHDAQPHDVRQTHSATQQWPMLAFIPGSADSPSRIAVQATGSETHAGMLEDARIDPKAVLRLVFPDARKTTISIKGAVLNALRGYPVEVADLPAMTEFLRKLDGAAYGRGSYRGWGHLNAPLVYEVLSTLQPGEALSPELIDAIHLGIEKFFASLPSTSGSLNLPAP